MSKPRLQYGHWKSEYSTIVTLASFAPLKGSPWTLILAMTAFAGSTLVSRTSPTTTNLRSGEAMKVIALLPCGPPMLSVPSLEPLKVVESLRPVTVTVAVGGRLFFLRKYLMRASSL